MCRGRAADLRRSGVRAVRGAQFGLLSHRVSGDENDQSATSDAFDVLYYVAGKRLDRALLTVVDATNTSTAARAGLVKLAREHDVRCRSRWFSTCPPRSR